MDVFVFMKNNGESLIRSYWNYIRLSLGELIIEVFLGSIGNLSKIKSDITIYLQVFKYTQYFFSIIIKYSVYSKILLLFSIL